MARLQRGGSVKAGGLREDSTDESERVRVGAESCDDETGVLFGKLDSVPLLGTKLRLGNGFAVSHDKVVEHRKASDFERQ